MTTNDDLKLGEVLLYQTEDGDTKIDVRLQDGTLWLTQMQMAELFQSTKQNISLHINNIFDEQELLSISTVKEYLTVQKEGNREKLFIRIRNKRAQSSCISIFRACRRSRTSTSSNDNEKLERTFR